MENITLAVVYREAEEEARGRIRRDKEGASPEVAGLLEEIAARLCEDFRPESKKQKDFDASELRRTKKPSRALEAEFKATTGFTLAAYIKEQRMLTATRLLMTTNLPVNVIAAHVGGVRVQGWSHAYTQWAGRQPSKVRQEAEGTADVSELETIKAFLFLEIEQVDHEQSATLHAFAKKVGGLQSTAEHLAEEALALERILEELGSIRAAHICRRTPIKDGTLFEALCKRSRESGRRDRRKGVELGEMALALVEGNFEYLGEEAPGLLALAWARLGNARRLAADFDGAETAFRRSETWLGKAGKSVVDKEAEILALKGSLRLYQRRFAEAQDLLDEAAGLSEALGNVQLLVDVLHQRAAAQLYQDKAEAALRELKKAWNLIPKSDKRRQMASLQHRLFSYVLINDLVALRAILSMVEQLSKEADDRASWLQIRWIEGLCCREEGNAERAESLLAAARDGYLNPKDPGMLAIVSLELALLYLEQGRLKKVVAHAAEALPALEALKLPEAASAYKVLHEAVLQREIERGVLEQARQILLRA